jgi:hypothetical protein
MQFIGKVDRLKRVNHDLLQLINNRSNTLEKSAIQTYDINNKISSNTNPPSPKFNSKSDALLKNEILEAINRLEVTSDVLPLFFKLSVSFILV